MNRLHLTSLTQQEGALFVALCPELDIASQGETREGAKKSLREAVELFLETALPSEISRRLTSGPHAEPLEVDTVQEVRVGQTAGAVRA